MSLYECIFVTRADVSKQDVAKLSEKFAEIVTENSGKIIKEEYWGLRQLAYKINKSSKGHYFFLGVDAPSAAIDEVKRQAHIDENIVRQMNVRVDVMDKEPTCMMNKDRDARPRRAA